MIDITKRCFASKIASETRTIPDADPDAATDGSFPLARVPAKPQTKASLVQELLGRESGASLTELCKATGWLPHTCRAYLTGLRKRGQSPEKAKRDDGVTFYRLAPAEVAA